MSKKSASSSKAVSPPVIAVALSASELESAWKQLGALLKEKDKEEVQHASVQAIAEKIFQSSVLNGAADGDALEVLSVALLQQSRWKDLSTLLSQHLELVRANAQLAFHYAYALYRDKQHTKSLDELKKRGANVSDGELHLQAQASYRAGNYSAAAKVYRETTLSQDDDVELQANMLAALVSAGLLEEAKAYIAKLKILTQPPSFELAYNASCCLIESGDYASALQVLKKAQSLCRELLEEDELSPAEIDNEMAVLEVQEAFLLQCLSKSPNANGTENDQALAIYTKVLTQHPTDANVLSIASNNVITLRKGAGSVWDSLKKSSKAIESIDLKDMTLSARQKSAIQFNRALALFHGKQTEKARDLLSALSKEFPTNVHHALAMAAVIARDKTKTKEAEDTIQAWIKANGESAPVQSVQAAHLGLAHLALLKGDASAAATILQNLAKSKAGATLAQKPAMIATIVALYERAGAIDQAHAVIQEGVAYWKAAAAKKDASAARTFQLILSSAGAWYNRLGRESDAAALLELLADQTTSGAGASRGESLARLVLAYRGDESKAAKFVAQLPALQTNGIDVKALEVAPTPETKRKAKTRVAKKPESASATVSIKDEEEGGEDTDTDGEADDQPSASLAKAAARKAQLAKKKKSKSKVKRYPKNFDPANPGPMPDVERWLPRWERSNQKKFNKRRAGNAIRGAQGSTNMANMPAKEAESSTDGVESKGKMSAQALAAARKRAGKGKR